MPSEQHTTLMSLIGLCALNLVASIDATALSVSIPVISSALDATAVQSFWCGTSFVLGSAVFQPIFAAFSNAFGRRPLVLIALVLFATGTIICSVASTIAVQLVGRTVQGVGGGGLLTMTYVIIADLYSLKDRAKALAVISLVWLLGTVCGPVIGGAFTTYVTWRWIFWVVLPFVAASLFLIAVFLKTPHEISRPLKAVAQTDWLGAVLLVASLTGCLMAISWGGSLYPWSSWQTILPLSLGGVGLAVFFVVEAFVPSSPIIPLSALGNPTAASAFLGTFILGVVQFGLLYYLPLYYQTIKGYSPLISGLALWPQCLLSGPTTAASGMIIAKTGNYRWTIWLGWILLTTGCGLLVLLDENTTVVEWIFINMPSGLGLGLLFTSQSIATQAATDTQHKAIVSGLTPFFRTIGQALGIVVCGAVFQNAFRSQLMATSAQDLHVYADRLVTNSASLEHLLSLLGSGSQDEVELVYVFNQALHTIWWALTIASGAAGILSLHIQQLALVEVQPAGVGSQQPDIERPVDQLDGASPYPRAGHAQPSAQTMRSYPSLDQAAILKSAGSMSTMSARQVDDMMADAKHRLAHGPAGVGDDMML